MRFYVICRVHPNEKIYINLANAPTVRNDIQATPFQLTCGSNHTDTYSRQEVLAEIGLAPVGGLILGSVLFLIDPIIGIVGASAGLFGLAAAEQERVRRFNESPG
jgi:hypothetical protein